MRVHLAYGRTGLAAELPDRNVVKCLSYQAADPVVDPVQAVWNALKAPVGSLPLAEIARGRTSACVVISDITRPVPNRIILPPILATLEEQRIPRSQILILIATGLHRPNLGDELTEMLGPEIVARYRVENHHGRELAEHTCLGKSPRGIPVWIDARYLAADLKITTGLIEPHFMAGFSGGRKLICPGLAAKETTLPWHSPRFLEHPNARSGVLCANPVHEENTWIARRAGCDFIVNTVLDDQRRILLVAAGDMDRAFQEGAKFVGRVVADTLPEPVDVVVTTAAGYPLDTTFYQSVKGMVAGMEIVRPGGTIILAASMSEGIGSPEFCRAFEEYETPEIFLERILHTECVTLDQWQVEELAKVCRKARIVAVSDGLPPETLRRLYVEAAPTVEAAVAECLSQYGPDATIAVIPKGPYVIAGLAPA
jgi:nickel-dependent lactate racemase